MNKCKCGEPLEPSRGNFEYEFCFDCWWKQDSRNNGISFEECPQVPDKAWHIGGRFGTDFGFTTLHWSAVASEDAGKIVTPFVPESLLPETRIEVMQAMVDLADSCEDLAHFKRALGTTLGVAMEVQKGKK